MVSSGEVRGLVFPRSFARFYAGKDIWLSRPITWAFRLIGMIFIDRQVLGIAPYVVLLSDQTSTPHISPLRRAEDSKLIIRNSPRRAAESHSPRVRFFLSSSPFLYPLLPPVSSFRLLLKLTYWVSRCGSATYFNPSPIFLTVHPYSHQKSKQQRCLPETRRLKWRILTNLALTMSK